MASREEVVKTSIRESERVLDEARSDARQIRHEAEDYMDQKLAAFEATITKTLEQLAEIREAQEQQASRIEQQLAKTLEQVGRGRERLKGTTLAEEHLAEGQQEEAR
jgi:vacuolar-type H+-ATPase subunit H